VCDRVKYSSVATVLEVVRNVSDPHLSQMYTSFPVYNRVKDTVQYAVHKVRILGRNGTKVFRVFLLAIHSHLY
jgi:hypothetical protein